MIKKYTTVKTQGFSMSPLIKPGEVLFLEKTRFDNLHISDIVVFYDKKALISHRIIYKLKNKIITKGDNSLFFDESIDKTQILGKVIKVKGKDGQINMDRFISKIINYYFLFYSLAISLFPLFLLKIIRGVIRGRRILTKLLARLD